MRRTKILNSITGLLAKILPRGASAYVFGSQARGDYSENSDWDLLIILNGNTPLGIEDRGDISMPIYMLGAELGVEINPVLYTDSEWRKRSLTPFYKNVIKDRVKIWG